MRFVLTLDAEEFAARTERLLSARLECNVLATVLLRVLDGGHRDPPPLFAYGLTSANEVDFGALRTPPWPLLTSPLDGDPSELIALWLEADPGLAGVTAVPETARAIRADRPLVFCGWPSRASEISSSSGWRRSPSRRTSPAPRRPRR